MTNLNINRRNFLKAAGVAAGVGTVAAGAAVVAPAVAKAEYNQPTSTLTSIAIKYLDTPGYNLEPYADADKLERWDYDMRKFEHLSDISFDGKSWNTYRDELAVEKILRGDPNFNLRDIALEEGSNMSNGLAAFKVWQKPSNYFQTESGLKWEDTEENNNLTVKKAARFYGSGPVGVAELNRQWIYSEAGGKPFVFEDAEYPETTDEKWIIPNSINRVIVVTAPMDGAIAQYSPTWFGLASIMLGYSTVYEIVSKLAAFIQAMGYNAIPCCNETGLTVPMAIDAGLGELGRSGLLISPEIGSMMRMGKVLTDMPIAVDKPISFGAVEFCKTCRKCADLCPSKSISMDEEPSYTTYSVCNNPGMKKWYVNVDTCMEYWAHNADDCYACMSTCTYSKPQTWVHDVIKVTASKTTVFNSIFAQMDDAFGYGDVFTAEESEAAIQAWWADPNDRYFSWYDV